MMTLRYVFGVKAGDRFGCMADIGWITGHTYIVYGPLLTGVSTTLFESVPTYPTPSRYWQLVEKHSLTHVYTAPTVLRALHAQGDEWVSPYPLKSVRVFGSVGEPISPITWQWYYQSLGRQRCPIVDTFWQTETGGIVISFLATPDSSRKSNTPADMTIFDTENMHVKFKGMKPGSASFPFFGIEPVLINPDTHRAIEQPNEQGVLCLARPWPGMSRTIYGNPERYRQGNKLCLC